MAPVDPPAANSLSLGPVLDLIEQFQDKHAQEGAAHDLFYFPVAALRALCEQHAAQLRDMEQNYGSLITAALKAADFLCAPRREPEAE